MPCTFNLEKQFSGLACGLDEAGRGPLAGPVVAACVHIPEEHRRKRFWKHVTDSKQLPAHKREELYELIIAHTAHGVALSSVEEIDTINILHASLLAMSRAFWDMSQRMPANGNDWIALVDGNQKPRLNCQIQTVIKGDSISLSIAAASILAKVTRDRMMRELCLQFPVYGWSRNAGYGTPAHLEAIAIHGITTHHRKSFSPVRDVIRA